MTTRKYSSRSQQTTLTGALNSSATTVTVVSASALLGGATITAGETFTVVINPDTAIEEIVDLTAVASNTLTITRGIENAGAGQSHSAGAVVRHMAIGRDFREANEHIENITTAHGLTLADVITTTNTKTITGKTISAADNTLTGVVTLTGTQTLTNKTLTSPTINTPAISGGTVTGLSSPTNSSDAATKGYTDSILGSATAASSSATAAASSATSAATSASSAATSASSSATSATASASSATAAASSATTATNQATAATTSATSAATSATSSATSATASATSATAASTSATAAASSATAAASSATAAASSATAASGSATSASDSLTSVTGLTGSGLVRDMGDITTADTTTSTYINVSTLLASAATSATSSATSASSSATSASSSATSASAAATSASSAATSATAAAASYDSFDDRYLGAKASDPSVDNDGNALIVGALYFNSTTPGMYVWTGSAWTVMATSGDIESVTAGTGLSGGGTAGAVTVSLDTSSIYVVPSQSTHNGKFLTTDGSTASWVSISDWGSI
jgi:hypothetical protein